MFPRPLLKTGGVTSTSTTVTLNVAWLELPCASVAVQVTVVVPTAKTAPEAGVQLGAIGPAGVSFPPAGWLAAVPARAGGVAGMSARTRTTGAGVQLGAIGPSRLSFALAV